MVFCTWYLVPVNYLVPGTWYPNTGCVPVGKTVLPRSANPAAAAAAAAAAAVPSTGYQVPGTSSRQWWTRSKLLVVKGRIPLNSLLTLFCTTFALEIAHKIHSHRALLMAAGCDKLNQQKMLDARCSMLDARYNDKSEFLV